MKILRMGNNLVVVLDSGGTLSIQNCTDEIFNSVYNNQNDEEFVKQLLIPNYNVVVAKAKKELEDYEVAENSKIITVKGESFYMLDICELSLPPDLVKAILSAEKDNNQELIQSYKNFWILVSLNPDSRVRNNLFWFLNKWGMTITKSGLFVTYRNADIYAEESEDSHELQKFVTQSWIKVKTWKKSPKNYWVNKSLNSDSEYFLSNQEESTCIGNLAELYNNKQEDTSSNKVIYTDRHSKETRIKLGKIVSKPRSECDSNQDNVCSRGLHQAGKDWLEKNYFGDVGLVCLVNPADVIAVPPKNSYGKMRVCAYYPMAVADWDEEGHIKDLGITDGFEDDFMDKINYTGEINNDDINPYKITIPNIPELDHAKINENLRALAKNLNKL